MSTRWSELTRESAWPGPSPRIYADANVPAGLVAAMRNQLHWDVLFVLEDPSLRRAADARHYQLAQQLRRTLITLDRDYLDDRRFPPAEGAGVLVIQAPNEGQLLQLMVRVNRRLFGARPRPPLPLAGQKLQINTDWGRE